jgi:small subunit ribosomal protein S20
MPNTKSAKKRMRQNVERRLRNRATKSAMRTQIKRVVQAVGDGDAARANDELRLAVKKLDQAAAKKVIHKNAAARMKSRLARRVNGLAAPASTA